MSSATSRVIPRTVILIESMMRQRPYTFTRAEVLFLPTIHRESVKRTGLWYSSKSTTAGERCGQLPGLGVETFIYGVWVNTYLWNISIVAVAYGLYLVFRLKCSASISAKAWWNDVRLVFTITPSAATMKRAAVSGDEPLIEWIDRI